MSSHRYSRLDLEAVISTAPSVASTHPATICNTHTHTEQTRFLTVKHVNGLHTHSQKSVKHKCNVKEYL